MSLYRLFGHEGDGAPFTLKEDRKPVPEKRRALRPFDGSHNAAHWSRDMLKVRHERTGSRGTK